MSTATRERNGAASRHEPDEQERGLVARKLANDCAAVADVILANPGVPGKRAIAAEARMGVARVARCIRWINHEDSPYARVEYGECRPQTGRYAGERVKGWFPIKRVAYQQVMGQAEEHSALAEDGLHDSRATRFVAARSLGTKKGEAVAEQITDRIRDQRDRALDAIEA